MAKTPPRRTRTGRTTEKARALFLASLSKCGNVGDACRAGGVGRSTAYEWRHRSKAFSAAWDSALDEAADVLEAEVRRRGVTGVLQPVFHKGEIVGRVRKYSDVLLIFLLKSVKPERYDDAVRLRRAIVSGGPSADELAHDIQAAQRAIQGLMHGVNLPDEG